MSEVKALRLSKLAKEFNVGISTIVEYLKKKGVELGSDPNVKISPEVYDILAKEFTSDINIKKESEKLGLARMKMETKSLSLKDVEKKTKPKEEEEDELELSIKDHTFEAPALPKETKPVITGPKVIGKMILEEPEKKKVAKEQKVVKTVEKPVAIIEEKTKEKKEAKIEDQFVKEKKVKVHAKPVEPEEMRVKVDKHEDLKVLGTIDLDSLNQKTRPTKKKKSDAIVEALTQENIKEIKIKNIVPLEVEGDDSVLNVVASDPEEETLEKVLPLSSAIAAKVSNYLEVDVARLASPTIIGKMDLNDRDYRKRLSGGADDNDRKKRKRIKKGKAKIEIKDQTQPLAGKSTFNSIKERPAFPPKPAPASSPSSSSAPSSSSQRPGANAPSSSSQRPGANAPSSSSNNSSSKKKKGKKFKQEVNPEEVDRSLKDTLSKLGSKQKSKGSKYRRDKRDLMSQRQQDHLERMEHDKMVLRVTEFVSVSELSSMMDVPVTDVISSCMSLGLMVSINQRLTADTIVIIAEEFGYTVEFTTSEVLENVVEIEDKPEDLLQRPPVVTVMGHVDHGKTKLLDYIRSTNVIAGEAGGITQHIGAYHVTIGTGHQMTFLDTPGHEAFTAMRARGAQVTDIAIIVVAADDGIMPQTVEAINHAAAAGVPIVFAINKVDKPSANPEKVKEQLANMNYLVEDWGGKFQSQHISAKDGTGIKELLDKVLLETEMLDLKANPNRLASGTVVESSLDKGKGYVATVLVQTGTMKVGDYILVGSHSGKVKAMYNERNQRIIEAGPSVPVLVLGIDGAPQAGDKFSVMADEKEAREIATKRNQLQREQGMRAHKHITLDEIGRRIAIGGFKELNVIVKGDVDGSVEALADSIIKLSTSEIQVNIVHKAVGQISESDILLAAASNAIVIGFQVRPSLAAKKLAEKEQIDIRIYSIIYDTIKEIKTAMEGMLSPEIREDILATLEVIEIFKITKVGTIAGCMVRDGKITRDAKVRLIRDGIVVYTGDLDSLKRFKDEVKEATNGQDCGLCIKNFNDIKVGDIVEAFKEVEVKKTL